MTYAEVYQALLDMGLEGEWSLTVETWRRPGKEPMVEWELYVPERSPGSGQIGCLMVDEAQSGDDLIAAVRLALATKATPVVVGTLEDVGDCKVAS